MHRISKGIVALAFIAGTGFGLPARAEDGVIEGKGVGTVMVKNDELAFDAKIVVTGEGSEQDALASIARDIKRVDNQIKKASIDSGWVKFGQPYTYGKYSEKRPYRIVSYEARATIEFAVPAAKAKSADAIIDMLNSMGLSVGDMTSRVSEKAAQAASADARRKALAAARADAQIDADELGCALGAPTFSGEQSRGRPTFGFGSGVRAATPSESTLAQDTVAVTREGPVTSSRVVYFSCRSNKTN